MEASKTKTILRLPDLEHARTAGLNSLTSRDAELRTASGSPNEGAGGVARNGLGDCAGLLRQPEAANAHVRFKEEVWKRK